MFALAIGLAVSTTARADFMYTTSVSYDQSNGGLNDPGGTHGFQTDITGSGITSPAVGAAGTVALGMTFASTDNGSINNYNNTTAGQNGSMTGPIVFQISMTIVDNGMGGTITIGGGLTGFAGFEGANTGMAIDQTINLTMAPVSASEQIGNHIYTLTVSAYPGNGVFNVDSGGDYSTAELEGTLVVINAVPEPASLTMIVLGGGILLSRTRRRLRGKNVA